MPISGKFVSDRSRSAKSKRLERTIAMIRQFDLTADDIIYSGRVYPTKLFQRLVARSWDELSGEKAWLLEDAVLKAIGTYPKFPNMHIDPAIAPPAHEVVGYAQAA